jgi:ammonia channel protein AmtB
MSLASLLAQATPQFPEQVTTSSLVQNLVYASGTVGAIVILAGLLAVDLGGVRRVNVFAATIEKLVGFFIGFAVYFFIGFAIWNWQYYVAFEVESPYWQAIKDWWLGGTFVNDFAQNVDPASMGANLNNQQVFMFFLACFAGIVNVLIHLSVTERMKAAAYYVICVVAAVMSSLLSWLTYGSAGPLTNAGFHDFFGIGFVYLFPAGMALILVRKVGQRPGMYEPHPKVPAYRSYNLGLTTVGVVLIFSGLPMVIFASLFFFAPEAYAVSVTMATTSVGVAFNNLGLAWAGGALAGAAIAYWKKSYIYLLLGPLGAYVAGAPALDIYQPWQMFLVALGAPFACYIVYEATQRRGWDEHKLTPLFLGAGIYGLLIVGVIKWGTPQGGYFGLEEGDFAFQNAEVNLLWQAIGVVVSVGLGVVTAAVLAPILERTTGLRLSEEEQVAGVDIPQWGLEPDAAPYNANGGSAHLPTPAPAKDAPAASAPEPLAGA